MKVHLYSLLCASLILSTYLSIGQAHAEDASQANTEAEATTEQPSAERGQKIFESVCFHCHKTTYDESAIGAPGLRGVLERHEASWINQWLKSPETFAQKDDTAKDLITSNKFGLAMPTLPVTQDAGRRADIIEYLKTLK